jgi:hypothetical protein
MPEWDAVHADDYKLAIAMDSGDEELVNEILFEQKRDMVEEALTDNFDTSIKKTGELAEREKLQAKAKKIHGMSTSPESINGYLMTFDAMKNGPIREYIESAYDAKLREAARDTLTTNAVYNLSKVGLRGSPADLSDTNKIGRAEDRVVDYNLGVDGNTGALIAGLPTDGGHGDNFPHKDFPEYSNARWNMGVEQGYINKSKGNKIGMDAQVAMRNSLKNKMKKDESGDVIRSVANGWEVGEGYGPMEDDMTPPKNMREALAAQKYKDEYMDGVRTSIDEEGEGDNRSKAMIFKNQGDVIIEGSPRLNGNGKNGH